MNKMGWVCLFTFLLMGCSIGREKAEMYMDNPEYIIKDPEFSDYQEKLDTLERSYLSKEITYAEYLEKKEALEKGYDTTIKKREKIISPDE